MCLLFICLVFVNSRLLLSLYEDKKNDMIN